MSEALGLFNLHHCKIITKIHRMNWSLATQTSEDTETFLRLPRGESKFGKATITPQGHVTIVLGTWLEKEHKPFLLSWEQAALAPLPAVVTLLWTPSHLCLFHWYSGYSVSGGRKQCVPWHTSSTQSGQERGQTALQYSRSWWQLLPAAVWVSLKFHEAERIFVPKGEAERIQTA